MVIAGTNLLSTIVPYVHILSSSSNTYCSQCFKSSDDLKRCSKCHRISYCSISCQRHDWIYHKHECSHLHEIIDEYDLTRLFLRLILRYKTDCGIQNSSTKRKVDDLLTHENEIRVDKRRFLIYRTLIKQMQTFELLNDLSEQTIFELFCRLVINTLTIHESIDLKSIGYGLYLDATVYNHSCRPTCHTIFNGIELTIRTICEQATNDEFTINYIDLLDDYQTRQNFLKENYYFSCRCVRCLENDVNERIILEKIHFEEQQMDKSIEKQDFKKAYQSSQNLLNYYPKIMPNYHAYLSLHYLKHLKLELYLADTISDLILQSTMNDTLERVKISMGNQHPLTCETIRLCEQYQLELMIKQRQMSIQ